MDTSRIQEILIIWGNSCTKGKRGVSLQKIGCGSAIKVNFIALALHYLCRKNNLTSCDYVVRYIDIYLRDCIYDAKFYCCWRRLVVDLVFL